MRSYPVHDLHLPSTYLLLPEKRNKLRLFCRLNLVNSSSLDKVVSRRKCKHKEISPFVLNLFISLAYYNLLLLENLELLGYPTLVGLVLDSVFS